MAIRKQRAVNSSKSSSIFCHQLNLEIETIAAKSKQQRKQEIKTIRTKKSRKRIEKQTTTRPIHENLRRTARQQSNRKNEQPKPPSALSKNRPSQQSTYTKNIFHQQTEDTCRVCNAEKETIHHISGCTALAPTKYLQRHDKVCKYVHELLLREHGFNQKRIPWYKHLPKPVEENENVKILWNFAIQTDHQINNNEPDIVIVDKTKKEALLIDIAIPADNNVSRKRLEKIRNYTDLSVELKTLWGLNKVKIVPVIIGAMQLVSFTMV